MSSYKLSRDKRQLSYIGAARTAFPRADSKIHEFFVEFLAFHSQSVGAECAASAVHLSCVESSPGLRGGVLSSKAHTGTLRRDNPSDVQSGPDSPAPVSSARARSVAAQGATVFADSYRRPVRFQAALATCFSCELR